MIFSTGRVERRDLPRVAGGLAAATRKRLRGLLSRGLFLIGYRLLDWAAALDGETIDVPTADDPPRPWSMADEVELMLADQKAELDAHDARSALLNKDAGGVVPQSFAATRSSASPAACLSPASPLANVEPAVLRKPVAPIKRGAALRAVKGKP